MDYRTRHTIEESIVWPLRLSRPTLDWKRQPIVIPYENDEAYTIASAYNLMLKDLNSAISREKEFIADASHELKNPLAATSAALEIPLHNQLFDERCRALSSKRLWLQIMLGLKSSIICSNCRKFSN